MLEAGRGSQGDGWFRLLSLRPETLQFAISLTPFLQLFVLAQLLNTLIWDFKTLFANFFYYKYYSLLHRQCFLDGLSSIYPWDWGAGKLSVGSSWINFNSKSCLLFKCSLMELFLLTNRAQCGLPNSQNVLFKTSCDQQLWQPLISIKPRQLAWKSIHFIHNSEASRAERRYVRNIGN